MTGHLVDAGWMEPERIALSEQWSGDHASYTLDLLRATGW